ncbi:microtubule organization protein AKNA isoform X3 [Alosa sapidissima]|uniref:microtubule organization protein AKNA isoform X3 n=1 Tax=Alosa sapidissima TaxID=34773 RepID=UPI001C083A72|nr:microtubule organization protein AKNA isoform X3 [Alosa sapidissima]
MERKRQSITAGELEWTPAPEPASPASPASPGGSEAELSWEGGGGEEEDEFQSQMDERGIIGLEETQGEELMLGLGEEMDPDEDDFGSSPYFERRSQGEGHEWGLGGEEEQGFGEEEEWDEEQEQSGIWDTGTPEPHKGPPMTLQDLSFNLSELLDSDPAGEDTNTPSQLEDHSLEGQDSLTLQEGWTEDERQHRVGGDGDVNRVTQNRNRNWTPSHGHSQVDTTEDEVADSEWEEFQNVPAPQVRARNSGSRQAHCDSEYRTGSNGPESSDGESMKVDQLGEQTGYHLTPTPSPRRSPLDFQEIPQPSNSVCKSELRLGHRNNLGLEPGLSSSILPRNLPTNSYEETNRSIQGSPESSDATFSKAELRDSPSRSSPIRPTHHKSRKNRFPKADLHAGGETEEHYPQAFEDLKGPQKVVHNISSFTRHSTSHTPPPSPHPVPHTVPLISPPSHLLHLSMEDPLDFPGIQEEKFPEASCTESLPDSSVCPPRPTPSRRNQHDSQESPQSSAPAPSRAGHRKSPPRSSPDRTHHNHLRSPKTSKIERRRPGAAAFSTSPAASHTDIRRGKLTHPSPDFSKVQPRVHFPKTGYKPPKSKHAVQQDGEPPEPLMVFKSPAEIVREVLLSSSEDPQESPCPGDGGPHGPLNRTVPEGFRDPQQATALMQQLQEDYKRLLTKYAAAENTIDRLRLEAKVGLYSDPPKPSHSVQSGSVKEGSKVMTLSFPQAQRAELDAPQQTLQRSNSDHAAVSPARPSSVDSVSRQRGLRAIEQLTTALLSQVQRFHLQLDTFEELLRRGQLKAHEQMKGLHELAQGQEALERAYLAAREEHKFLQQTGSRLTPFDPNRDLEGQIFQSGMRLDELKEWVEQTQQSSPMSEPQPSPHPISLSPRESDTLPRPQGPVCPVGVGDQMTIRVEVSSVSGVDMEEEEDEDEEDSLPSLLLRPLQQKHQCVERDFSNLLGQYQSVKELPQVLDVASRPNWHSTPDPDATPLPGDDGIEARPHWPSDSEQGQSRPPQQGSLPMLEPSTGPGAESLRGSLAELHLGGAPLERCSSYPGAQDVSSPSRASGSRRSGSSSLYSLGDGMATATTTLNKRTYKAQARNARAPSQDGLLSPETDSGFVGSESRLTPALHSPLQLGEKARTTPLEETEETESPVTVTDSGRPPSRDPQQRPLAGSTGSAGGAPTPLQRRGGGGERRPPPSLSSSSSPQRWAREPLQAWTSSGASETHSLSGQEEKEQNSQYYRRATNQPPVYQRNSSLSAPYRHGDHLKAQSSVQLTNQCEALQSLQVEVNRLKECLEGTLCVPLSTSTEPASPHSPPAHSTPYRYTPHRYTPHRPSKRNSRRAEDGESNRVTEEEEEEEEEVVVERRTQRSRSMSMPRPRPETLDDSGHAQSEPKQEMRYTAVFIAARRESLTVISAAQESSGGHTCQRLGPSVVPEDIVDANQRGNLGTAYHGSKHCANPGTAQPAAGPERSGSGKRLSRSASHCCPLRRSSESRRSTAVQTDRQVDRDPGPSSRQPRPESSPRRHAGRVFLAPPPGAVLGSVPMVQCVPVYPSVLYYPGPKLKAAIPMPYISVGTERPSQAKAYRIREGERGRSLSSSLDRAIIAAADMKSSSKRMVRTISTGLQHQRALSQSCLY